MEVLSQYNFAARPTFPTAAFGTNNTEAATTAFVQAALAGYTPNLSNYVTLNTVQSIVAKKTFTGQVDFDRGVNVADSNFDARFVNGAHTLSGYARLSSGSYNPAVQAGDKAFIYTNGTEGTGAFVLAPWSTTNLGALRLVADGFSTLGGNLSATGQLKAGSNVESYSGFKFQAAGSAGYEFKYYNPGGGITSDSMALYRHETGGSQTLLFTSSDVAGVSSPLQIVSSAANAFRMTYGSYGAFWRNDGSSIYLLFTNSGDQWGTWNNLRPWYVNLSTGYHTFGTGANFQGNLDISAPLGIKIRSAALGNGLDIAASPTQAGGTDPDVYFYNRNNGAIWWGTNNTLRGKFHADGRIGWNHQVLATGDTFGIGFNPYNANVGRAALVSAGAYGGGVVLQDSGYWAGAFITADNSGTYHIGVGGASGLTGRVRVTNADYNQFTVEGVIKSASNQAALYFKERDSSYEFAWYATAGTAQLWHSETGSRVKFSKWASFDVDGNGIYLNSGWFRTYGQNGIYFSDYTGGWYMTDTTYVRAYNGKAVAASNFVMTSDETTKRFLGPVEYRGRLNPIIFERLLDGTVSMGFGAQSVQQLYPWAVTQHQDETWGRMVLNLGAMDVCAILSAQLNALEDKVLDMERRMYRAAA